jgi:hypothetical protein
MVNSKTQIPNIKKQKLTAMAAIGDANRVVTIAVCYSFKARLDAKK